MTTRLLTGSLPRLSSAFHHLSFSSYPTARSTPCFPSLYSILTTAKIIPRFPQAATAVRSLATGLPKLYSLEDAPGTDWEHWQVIFWSFRKETTTRDQIIDTYIKTLAMFVGRSLSLHFCLDV